MDLWVTQPTLAALHLHSDLAHAEGVERFVEVDGKLAQATLKAAAQLDP